MGSYEDNEKKINIILERALGILAQSYTLKKLDPGKFADPVTMNTQFRIAHYEVEGVGHLMTMRTEGNPKMQMVTITLTPYFKALPLISSDFMYGEAGGMSLIEIYELTGNRSSEDFQRHIGKYSEKLKELSDIPDIPSQPSFLDEIRPVFTLKARVPERDYDVIESYAGILGLFKEQEAETEPLCGEDKEKQAEIQRKYVDDLIDQNGFSTKMWVNDHGEAYVREYYHSIFFGV